MLIGFLRVTPADTWLKLVHETRKNNSQSFSWYVLNNEKIEKITTALYKTMHVLASFYEKRESRYILPKNNANTIVIIQSRQLSSVLYCWPISSRACPDYLWFRVTAISDCASAYGGQVFVFRDFLLVIGCKGNILGKMSEDSGKFKASCFCSYEFKRMFGPKMSLCTSLLLKRLAVCTLNIVDIYRRWWITDNFFNSMECHSHLTLAIDKWPTNGCLSLSFTCIPLVPSLNTL